MIIRIVTRELGQDVGKTLKDARSDDATFLAEVKKVSGLSEKAVDHVNKYVDTLNALESAAVKQVPMNIYDYLGLPMII